MKEYLQLLRQKTGYVSLKIRESEAQAKMFPPLYGQQTPSSWDSIVENQDREEEEPIVFRNPIEVKDAIIEEKTKETEKLSARIEEGEEKANKLKNTNDVLDKENKLLKQKMEDMAKQLRRTEILMETKLQEKLDDPDWDPENNSGFEITAIANLITEEEEPAKSNNGHHQSRKSNVLDRVQKKIEPSDLPKNEKLEKVKNKILERRLSLDLSSPSRGRSPSQKRSAPAEAVDPRPKTKHRSQETNIPRPANVSAAGTSATLPSSE